MKTYTRNTILYSVLTIAMVASYWFVRQDAKQFEAQAASMEVTVAYNESRSTSMQ